MNAPAANGGGLYHTPNAARQGNLPGDTARVGSLRRSESPGPSLAL
jgi:hypothetical protein